MGAHVAVVVGYRSTGITGAHAALVVGGATDLLIAGVFVICWRAWRGYDSLGRSFVLGVLVILSTSKVFSAQYMLWLFPLVAYVEGVRLRWALLALLTEIIFPQAYYANAYASAHPLTLPDQAFFMGPILARNAVLLALTLTYLVPLPARAWERWRPRAIAVRAALLRAAPDLWSRANRS
jgi:hypothetical protein